MTTDTDHTDITAAAASADAAIGRLEDALARLGDGDLHRAHRAGGWTVAQVVSHINVSTLLWAGNLHRLGLDADLDFFFREEIGHDALGYPPPTVQLALGQLAATRRTAATCLPSIDELLDRSVTIPDLGTMTVREWTPIIAGHVESHVQQALDIMRDREFLPDGL